MTYDPDVYGLVVKFLEGLEIDSDRNRQLLSEHVQREIEEWITAAEEGDEGERVQSEKRHR